MAKDLVWLENLSFSAWGCSGCAWIIPSGPTLTAKKTALACEAFAHHDCKNFPRYVSPKGKRKESSKAKKGTEFSSECPTYSSPRKAFFGLGETSLATERVGPRCSLLDRRDSAWLCDEISRLLSPII